MSVLDEIIKTEEISLQQILNNLLSGDKDLDLKTHIHRPKQLASLVVMSNHLDDTGFDGSAKLIDKFINKYSRYMVSFKRMSRIEIIKALSHLVDNSDEIGGTRKLTTNLG